MDMSEEEEEFLMGFNGPNGNDKIEYNLQESNDNCFCCYNCCIVFLECCSKICMTCLLIR